MTRDEITHAKTAYNCAVSVLRAFVAQPHDNPIWAAPFTQRRLDDLRYFEIAIEHWNPTPDDEGDTNGHER